MKWMWVGCYGEIMRLKKEKKRKRKEKKLKPKPYLSVVDNSGTYQRLNNDSWSGFEQPNVPTPEHLATLFNAVPLVSAEALPRRGRPPSSASRRPPWPLKLPTTNLLPTQPQPTHNTHSSFMSELISGEGGVTMFEINNFGVVA